MEQFLPGILDEKCILKAFCECILNLSKAKNMILKATEA